VGEADRKMLKAAIKHGASQDHVRHRIIPQEAISKWAKKLEDMKEEVAEVLREEKEEKHVSLSAATQHFVLLTSRPVYQLRQAEMELRKGENMIEHETEIYARPARTWFQSAKEKRKAAGLLPHLLALSIPLVHERIS
jgi:ATP-dependent RNA helicase DDX27